MKKTLTTVISALISFTFAVYVDAKENIVYKNDQDISFTKNEYDFITDLFFKVFKMQWI